MAAAKVFYSRFIVLSLMNLFSCCDVQISSPAMFFERDLSSNHLKIKINNSSYYDPVIFNDASLSDMQLIMCNCALTIDYV